MIRSLPLALVTSLFALPAAAQDDQAYAETLWQVMTEARLVGDDAIKTRPYPGNDPHGAILEFLETDLDIDGETHRVIVKRNYMGGEGVDVGTIWQDGSQHLAATTVMVKREGYDPEHDDRYWVKYQADASIEAAGKVQGCIDCHQTAEGEDYIYSYTR